MFALRFGQIDPLISSYITPNSRVLYVRDIRERVQKVAPFLQWDSDPYPVLSNGHVVYMIDGIRLRVTTRMRNAPIPPACLGQRPSLELQLRQKFREGDDRRL